MGADHRRHHRIRLRLPVWLSSKSREELILTEDISFSGLFVRTDTPQPLRRLLKLRLLLPPQGTELAVNAMVVHSLAPEQAAGTTRVGGMGLRFFGLDGETASRWTEFVSRCATLDEGAGRALLEAWSSRPHDAESLRRRFPRLGATIDVQLASSDDLVDLVTRDLSHGGTFLLGETGLAPGAEVTVRFQPPGGDEGVEIQATVVRSVQRPAHEVGVALEFQPIGSGTRPDIDTLLEGALPALDELDLCDLSDALEESLMDLDEGDWAELSFG